jgi:hypothetical protein
MEAPPTRRGLEFRNMSCLEFLSHALCFVGPTVLLDNWSDFDRLGDARGWLSIACCVPCFGWLAVYLWRILRTRVVDVRCLTFCVLCCYVGYRQIQYALVAVAMNFTNVR